jgi:hypothetical protein
VGPRSKRAAVRCPGTAVLIAAGSELGRIGAAQAATGRAEAMLRQYVEQGGDAAVYQRLDELFREGTGGGLLPAPPELLSEITAARWSACSPRSCRANSTGPRPICCGRPSTPCSTARSAAHTRASTMNNSGWSCRRPAMMSRRWARDWGNRQGGIGDRS